MKPVTVAAELIRCHDCGNGVAFTAGSCPHCGSIEPRGPYVHSRREWRRHRGEQRHDSTLAVATVACTVGGAAYGAIIANGAFLAVMLGLGYGLVGLLIGVPVGFVINITRHFGR